MRIALVDSGIGMLSTAAALHAARPDADLFLSMDPDHMPWGARTPDAVIGRALAGARAAWDAAGGLDAVVVPCNTASVHGLARLREVFEPSVPVIGTVPAIKPAARSGGPIAVWSTVATTRSGYQRRLVETFAQDIEVTPVACAGLAEAVESADPREVADAVSYAAGLTPGNVRAVVLGCTHYDLVGEEIVGALGQDVALHTAAHAVAAQALRRVGDLPHHGRPGRVRVLASGRPAELPAAALTYPAGRSLMAQGSPARSL
ncbi:aspartate/glutamate racemase family protein [Nocardiopsis sp. HNM0947]|uniref:Aspartate/glutamate racemase family protein n=1 Tax=Nocardiopsis coralli TaxID=2772213 RepID=A0ABR9P3X8_9ACTN|nr:aspartate/glutamate racemase family protein [Nocardiopsis coralli]MBE2998547.1 aspartate/glutamate racemase family protein [Nocardiopsis coralli]